MRLRQIVIGLVVLGVLLAWFSALGNGFPTWTRSRYSMPTPRPRRRRCGPGSGGTRARGICCSPPARAAFHKTPTMGLRGTYNSWPPGAFVIVYLAAKFFGIQPSVPLVNWINVTMHGLIALAAAFTVFNLALMNRLGRVTQRFACARGCISDSALARFNLCVLPGLRRCDRCPDIHCDIPAARGAVLRCEVATRRMGNHCTCN